jgi:hypothetical protein
MRSSLLLPVVAVLLSSCSVQPVTNCISIPQYPVKPTLTVEQDASIPDAIYEVLADREDIDKAYIKALKDRIEANNRNCR